jgi:hypothetical protein
MIKYCNTCKFFIDSNRDAKCFNPLVNKNDYYMLSHPNGEGYGSSAIDQRRTYSYLWQSHCGTNGRLWVPITT